LDKTLNDISNFGNEDDIIPLNLSRGYIEDIIGESTDLVLSKYTSSEDDLFYKVNVTFEFKTIDDLNKLLPNENSFSLTQDGDESILSQGISSGDSGDINEESLNILRDIYGDHYFRFLVNVPRDIISVSNGTKTEDRVAVYQESFVDIIASSENKAWSIRW